MAGGRGLWPVSGDVVERRRLEEGPVDRGTATQAVCTDFWELGGGGGGAVWVYSTETGIERYLSDKTLKVEFRLKNPITTAQNTNILS